MYIEASLQIKMNEHSMNEKNIDENEWRDELCFAATTKHSVLPTASFMKTDSLTSFLLPALT